MLSEDLRQRLLAAGLPTDLEGMLEAASEATNDVSLFRYRHEDSEYGDNWFVDGGFLVADGESASVAVARWLLAAKEAHRG